MRLTSFASTAAFMAVVAWTSPSSAREAYAVVDGDLIDDNFTFYGSLDVGVTQLSFTGIRRVEFPTFGTIFGGLSNRANVQVTPLLTPTGFFHEDNSLGKGICNFTLDFFRPGALTLRCFKGNGSGMHRRDALICKRPAKPF
ncbi:MAG: hypothetical protein AAFN74_17415 [Myxococcota bacterium]